MIRSVLLVVRQPQKNQNRISAKNGTGPSAVVEWPVMHTGIAEEGGAEERRNY